MNTIEVKHLARVYLPPDKKTKMKILGMYSYHLQGAEYFRNYNYSDSIVLLPPNMEKLAKVAKLTNATIIDNRSEGEPLDAPFVINDDFNLRDYQVEPANELVEYIKENNYGTLEAGCGTGKTVVMTYAAAKLGMKTLVLVDQTNLVTNWTDAFQFVCGKQLQKITSKTKEFGDCCICTFQLLNTNTTLRKKIRKMFGLLMVDECHTAQAATFKKVMFSMDNKFRIGCSATFFNKKLPIQVLHDIVAPTCVTMVDPHALVPDVEFVESGIDFPYNDPDMFGHKILPFLANSEERNSVVFDLIRKCAEQGRRIIVIGIQNIQADYWHNMCELCGIKSTVYTGSTSAKRDLQVKNDFNSGVLQVVFTSKKLDKGTDLAAADTLIIAKPCNNKSAVQQQSGRIVRQWEGKPTPIVYDIRDGGSLAQCFARNRARMYHNLGYNVLNGGWDN